MTLHRLIEALTQHYETHGNIEVQIAWEGCLWSFKEESIYFRRSETHGRLIIPEMLILDSEGTNNKQPDDV